jgi:hypothetical protein
MMSNDKKEFAELLNVTLMFYDKEVNKEMLDIWWNASRAYTLALVRQAFDHHLKDKDRGRFAPKPADLIAAIDKLLPDGRPGADEAWAIYPRSESESAAINDEISFAAQVALPLINEGDLIAARMAFKEAYIRVVEHNKLKGIKPKWFMSLGHDVDNRKRALEDALAKNLISWDYAHSLLAKPEENNHIAKLVVGLQLIPNNKEAITDELKAKNRRRIAEIREMLNQKNNRF